MKGNMDKLTLKVSEIKTNPNNPRLIKGDKFKKLVKSLKELPIMAKKLRKVVVDENNVILGGNMRFKAIKEAGMKEVHVEYFTREDAEENNRLAKELDPEYVDKTYEEQCREFVRKDNVSGGEWDWDILANEWDAEELDEWGLDTPDDWGENKEVKEDEAPEVSSEPPKSKLGEIYQLGRHRVMCGDSTDKASVELLMNGQNAELLFTSPPYSDMREYNGDKDLSLDKISDFISAYYDCSEYQAINLGIQRKDNNINQYWDVYIDKAKQCGYKFLSWNVWVKPGAGSVGNQSAFFPIIHEWIFVFGKQFKDINRTEEKKTKNNKSTRKVRQADGSMKISGRGVMGDKKELESVIFANPELGDIRQQHPATFSVDLPSKYIAAITNINDIVSDPFLGSGSTLIACEQTDRTCYGMELDQKYVDVIRKRYWKFVNDNNEEGWENGTPAI